VVKEGELAGIVNLHGPFRLLETWRTPRKAFDRGSTQQILPPMAEPPRHFPAPWRADKLLGGYVVRDATGQALAYVYSRETKSDERRAKLLTRDEARRIAFNIARLPELLATGSRQNQQA
jgi:hypothetical protein